jgi:hypothetical protein
MIRALTMGLLLATAAAPGLAADSKSPQRVFEMRTYITNEGKLEALHTRFRDHTNRLFKKHGIELVGYWTPQDKDAGKANTLIYILAYPSREAAAASWKAFQADPEWQKAREESHKNGVIVKEVKSVFLDPTDYSPIK